MSIYFDNASTTPLLPEVKEVMTDIINNIYGNPSSIHQFGRKSKTLLEDARKTIAAGIGASTGEIFFTSGATEANNMSLLCSVRDLGVRRIISSPTEHHCVIHTLDYIRENKLAEVIFLDVDSRGHIQTDELDRILKEGKNDLVSLMHANNEIGTRHPIREISEICRKHQSLFHCDMAQTITKEEVDMSHIYISFASGSAHKFFGPKGVGFIYINSENLIKPMLYGGSQERGMRSGTENIYGIGGMAEAFRIGMNEAEDRRTSVQKLRSYFATRLKAELHDISFNGDPDDQLYNILSVSFPPSKKSPLMMMNLDIAGIAASAGSACSSGAESESHVLEAIGHDVTRKTVRFSLSHFNTRKEVDTVVEKLKKITPSLSGEYR